MQRTLAADTIKSVGKTVKLEGWVNTYRDHGKIAFLDLRDRTGLVQVVLTPKSSISCGDVIKVEGLVKKRPKNLVNPNLATGTVEVEAKKITILNHSQALPFPIDTTGYNINEEVRLKYRYLDLRRPRMNQNIKIRSAVTTYIRNYLTSKNFVEIETPMLTKTTPEGARDFLVPSRLQPGNFYALPQSPQQYKQLLMVAGFERYFQFARCFRDEDPRADRAYGEFTQLDLEMSFVIQEDILQLIEAMFTQLVKDLFPHKKISKSPWPRIPHREAIKKYGTDKPDLRKNKDNCDELAFAWTVDFPLFTEQSEEDFFHGSGSAKLAPSHHMFTAPHPDDLALLESDPTKVRGLQHDLVLNGYEIGGGSIRIHDPKVQQKVFDLIGFTKEQTQQFEHMLTAFTYGVPPHGGIAPGLDRFLMVIQGEPSIREVMAFPAISSGKTAVVDAPSPASDEQLMELGIQVAATKQFDSTNSLFDRIRAKLDNLNIKYQVIEHEPVYTSQDAARLRDTDIKEGAKALVMIADKKPIMVTLSGAAKADFKLLKKLFGFKDLRMATPEEVEQITTVKIGAVPPFGSLAGIPTFQDESLAANKNITFNAGHHQRSITMSYQDYLRAEQPTVANFSKN